MNNKLKTCPFCGGEAPCFSDSGCEYRRVQILCVKCGCRSMYKDTREQAAQAWNKRV